MTAIIGSRLQYNLPHTSMRDLWIEGNDLIVATHGRSFWILDDISPLRQLDGINAETEPVLFKPGKRIAFAGIPIPIRRCRRMSPRDRIRRMARRLIIRCRRLSRCGDAGDSGRERQGGAPVCEHAMLPNRPRRS